MGYLKASALPALALRIELVYPLDRIYHKNRIFTYMNFNTLQITHLKRDIGVLTYCICIIKLGFQYR